MNNTEKSIPKTIEISVIIPVYNRAMELKRSLQSVLNQSVAESIEIWVVDDCSEENLFEKVIQPLGDDRIHYHRMEQKGNANVSRNWGIRNAHGSYVALLDSDDEWLPNHLETRWKMMELTGVDGLFGSHYLDNGNERKPIISRARRDGETMADYLLTDGVAPTPSFFLKTTAARSIPWDETLHRHQDYDFSIRFAEKFRFEPCIDLTVVVHWEKGVKRSENLNSQRRFIEKHAHRISPAIYNHYHAKVFFAVVDRPEITPDIVAYYQQQSVRFIAHCTRVEFLSTQGYRKSRIKRLFLRLIYAVRVFFQA